MAAKPNYFTARELQIIRDNSPAVAAVLLPHRKRTVLASKRYQMKMARPIDRERRAWSAEELDIMRQHYRTSSNETMMRRLPARSYGAIMKQAQKMGYRKRYLGTTDVAWMTGHRELVDQIRIRAKEDGISFKKLDTICGRVNYFSNSIYKRQRINLIIVAKAVEFFGGKLVIDWNDR